MSVPGDGLWERLKRRVSGGEAPPLANTAPARSLGLQPGSLPRVAIVILNYNGRHHLRPCFESLRALDYPEERLEVVLIDNGSSDGSREELEREHAWVRSEFNAKNVGFSAGCNQGAALAPDAEVLVFLNNDMRVEPLWLRELVAPIVEGRCQATTAKMLSWDGKLMNSAGGGMNFHGIGIQKGYLEPLGPEWDEPAPTLFACGGAMAIEAGVFAESGGFDEEFFAYYEDVDLGWRLWVLGHRIEYVPSAVCYHHHSSTSKTFPVETIRLLQVRNPFLACFKNYGEEHLRQVLPAQLALAVRRMFLVSGLNPEPYRIEHAEPSARGVVGQLVERARHAASSHTSISRVAAADLVGINDILGRWDHWQSRRAEIQGRRRREDAEIFALFHRPLWCIEDEPGYRELHGGTTSFFGIQGLFEGLDAGGKEPNK